MKNVFDVTEFGAVADGRTDCTVAIQRAIDEAEKVQGKVFVPSGKYLCGQLTMKPFVTIEGVASWTYKENGGTILALNDENAKCMLDISHAYGCVIKSLCLSGERLGKDIHGVATLREDDEALQQEDTTLIEHCRISNFSGDGAHMQRIWCFSVRHSQLCFNEGNGLYVKGWDAFISDNWFSSNKAAGVLSDKEISAVMFTGNRVEWNRTAGIRLINPIGVTLTGNAFDASGGPGLDLQNPKGCRSINVTVVGNSFSRSGMSLVRKSYSGANCHLHIERAMNVVVQSNVFYEGVDDSGDRNSLSPKTGMVIKKLKDCIIKDNRMMNCATENVYIDEGAHEGNNVIEIVGSVKPRAEEYIFPFFDD